MLSCICVSDQRFEYCNYEHEHCMHEPTNADSTYTNSTEIGNFAFFGYFVSVTVELATHPT